MGRWHSTMDCRQRGRREAVSKQQCDRAVLGRGPWGNVGAYATNQEQEVLCQNPWIYRFLVKGWGMTDGFNFRCVRSATGSESTPVLSAGAMLRGPTRRSLPPGRPP